jgi:DNA polymerase epsilon subunit 4
MSGFHVTVHLQLQALFDSHSIRGNALRHPASIPSTNVPSLTRSGPQKKKRIIKSRQSLAEKAQGTTLFPLSRVKRIIKADKELDVMSSEATFLVAVATEYFIKHFMEEGYTKARMERRRIVNYKDMASVVSRNDEFDFLRGELSCPLAPLSTSTVSLHPGQGCKYVSESLRRLSSPRRQIFLLSPISLAPVPPRFRRSTPGIQR